ncbi:CaiB/BaiF CoA-transferase family protein [Halalkalicoccus sp. NIPERK01]|uniref:CaiB/BaiF CoA transferase family protein n=1 Tax=Halalkalicoccus sp. NIPERK01 TaxID=3053469 RepID=UPI00256F0274|nr:CaiB/BaiF CoA-transferase family protein [Halalkalicoccus sp. NIPERK01]MDL5360960.1 CaiB/BaiF CoA-transferase family protein [Halalkalicoccus sp. NIPERK01]
MTGEARDATGEGPLAGLTVLDCSQVLVGPFCTMQLGDLGAEVIKVERPDVGDQTRGWYPPRFGEAGPSAYFASVNRNKRSVTLNLAREEGQEVLRTLAADADVLVENFRVGTMEGWGLGYGALSKVNPELIYCSLSGYGEWGPYSEKPAYDLMIQAEGGMMSITGEPGREPVRVGVAIADIGAGMYATQSILAALLARELQDVGGQKIDVSLLDGQAAWMSYMATNYFASGDVPGKMGSAHPTIVPYQAFETRDGHVVVAAASEKLWRAFCAAIDREDLPEDERFETNADRVENREMLVPILENELAEYTTEEALSRLAAHDVPARAVNDMADVFSHPQIEARGMAREVEGPAGTIEMPGSPMFLSETPTSIRRHPPELGEHTEAVLRETGYSAVEIDRFRDAGVI